MNWRLFLTLFLLGSIFLQFCNASALFFDDFNDGYAGWSSSGNVQSSSLHAIVPDLVHLKKTGRIWIKVSTVGKTHISVTFNLAATALENGDYCHVDVSYDNGSNFQSIFSIT